MQPIPGSTSLDRQATKAYDRVPRPFCKTVRGPFERKRPKSYLALPNTSSRRSVTLAPGIPSDLFLFFSQGRKKAIQGVVGHVLIQIEPERFCERDAAQLGVQILVITGRPNLGHALVDDGLKNAGKSVPGLVFKIKRSLVFYNDWDENIPPHRHSRKDFEGSTFNRRASARPFGSLPCSREKYWGRPALQVRILWR